jgi:hypothetical protein
MMAVEVRDDCPVRLLRGVQILLAFYKGVQDYHA